MQFLNPNVFYMMLIPLILLIILVLTSKEGIQQHFSKKIIDKLLVNSGMLSKNTRNVLFFLVLILFILALSRPVVNKQEHNIKQKLIPIVIALDISKSMKANDIYPNRISLAKQKLKALIKKGNNATIGIVLFAKDSFILSPVTEDFVSLNYIVDNLDTDVNLPNGSNIFGTLETTKLMLEDYKVKNLIILSDGGNKQDYKNEIEFAKKENIAVYAIGLATKKGAAIPIDNGYLTDKNGKIVTVKKNESIKQLALDTDGGYIDFTLDNTDINAIINRVVSQSKKEDISQQNVVIYTELFYFPLALGVFLLLIAFSSLPSFKKQSKAIALMIGIYLFPQTAYTYEFDFERIEKAKKQYDKKEYEQAANSYRELSSTPQSLYNLANSLYKDGKYQEAIDTYSKVVSEDSNLEASKLHNIGNGYVKQGKLEKAKEFYEKSLKIKEDKETKENLELVKKALKQQQKKQSNKEDKENQDKQKQNQNKSDKNENKSKNKQQDKKENKKQDKKEKSEQDQKKDKSQQKQEQKGSSKEQNKQTEQLKKEEISDMEERKWMERIKNQKSKIFIQKAPTTNKGNSNNETPW